MENNGNLNDINDKLIDLELAKRDNKNSKVRRYLPAFVFLASSYYSFLLALGLAVGYIGSKIFTKVFLESGKIDSVFINCGKYKIHLHHWITGGLLLAFVMLVDFFYLPRFFIGVVCGIMAHDVYDFNDWTKVFVKNDEK